MGTIEAAFRSIVDATQNLRQLSQASHDILQTLILCKVIGHIHLIMEHRIQGP